MKKPELNDTVYMVTDSVYYNKNRMPETEYRILKGTVIGIIHGGYTVLIKIQKCGAEQSSFSEAHGFRETVFL